ncbi:hypothetical protein A2U01_0050282 [Trifolium medium]|uniref:Uncharacterized protein n=1 Tax=Trifolium medium TaxID=97028 RepID=A0A392QZV6_9FABA|nr:hypothetical protein [Trifolium medium]
MFAFWTANGETMLAYHKAIISCSLPYMGNTSKDADGGKRATKASASVRKEKAAQNPPKKRSRKAPANQMLLRVLTLSMGIRRWRFRATM